MFVKVIDEINVPDQLLNEKLAKEFTKDLNEFCRTKNDNYNNKHLFTPSSVGSCARCLYFKAKDFPEDVKKKVQPYSIRRLDMGTYMHLRTEHYLHAMTESQFQCVVTEVSKTCEGFTDLGGTIDGILTRDREKYIFEYKTINDYEFKNLVEPLAKHIEQATAYSLIFGIKKALFLYEKFEKTSNQDIKVFVVTVTEEMRQDMLNRLSKIKANIEEEVMPPKDMGRCKHSYCRHKEQCSLYS